MNNSNFCNYLIETNLTIWNSTALIWSNFILKIITCPAAAAATAFDECYETENNGFLFEVENTAVAAALTWAW